MDYFFNGLCLAKDKVYSIYSILRGNILTKFGYRKWLKLFYRRYESHRTLLNRLKLLI